MTQGDAAEASGAGRRRLLKTGLATTGAAYVAPQILKTAVAGAATTTIYPVFIDPLTGACVGGAVPLPAAQPGCEQMNLDFGTAISGTPTLENSCPASGFTAVVGSGSVALSAAASYTFTFAGYSGFGCVWTLGPGSGTPALTSASAEINADSKQATFLDRGDFSATDLMVVVLSRTGSPGVT